jgi:hypothetical protein
LQTNLSYILLICIIFLTELGFSQDLKSQNKRVIDDFKQDTILKRDSLTLKKTDTLVLDSIKPKETIEDIILHVAKD